MCSFCFHFLHYICVSILSGWSFNVFWISVLPLPLNFQVTSRRSEPSISMLRCAVSPLFTVIVRYFGIKVAGNAKTNDFPARWINSYFKSGCLEAEHTSNKVVYHCELKWWLLRSLTIEDSNILNFTEILCHNSSVRVLLHFKTSWSW